MHIPDGFLDTKTIITTSIFSFAAIARALKQVQKNMPPKDGNLSIPKKLQRSTARAKLKQVIPYTLLWPINLATWFRLSRATTGEWARECAPPVWVLCFRTGGKCSHSKKAIIICMLRARDLFIQSSPHS